MFGKLELSSQIVPHVKKKKKRKKLFGAVGFYVTICHIQFYLTMLKIGNAAELG